MLEQTRGYLKAKGSIFGLNSCHFYENDYSKTMRFGIKTNVLNSSMITSKYWFEGNALDVSIRDSYIGKINKYSKEDVHYKIKESFSDGDMVYVKAIIDISEYLGNIRMDNQIVGIYSSKEDDVEINDFDQWLVFDSLDGNTLNAKLIDYRGRSMDFNKFIIIDDLIQDFNNMSFGDLIRCSGIVKNEPKLNNGLCEGKDFHMVIKEVIDASYGKYTQEDFDNQEKEELITDEALMPWEV